MDIDDLLERYQTQFNEAKSCNAKLECINLIINVKIDKGQNVYKDVKVFINCYLEAINEGHHGYDLFNANVIEAKIESFNKSEKVSIYKYLHKTLIKHHYKDEVDSVVQKIKKAELALIKEDDYWWIKPMQFGKFCLFITSLSMWTILFTLAIMFAIEVAIFLPSFTNIEWFKVSYVKYSDNFFCNHLSNIILFTLDVETDFKIIPLNIMGVIMITLISIIKWVFIINYLFKHLSNKID